MTALPPLAPLPPPEVQRSIPPQEWELYTDAWVLLLEARLETPESAFRDSAPKDESAVLFLAAFYHQLARNGALNFHPSAKAKTLRKLCFLLSRRYLLEISVPPPTLLEWTYLAEMSCCYPSSSAFKKLLSDAWDRHQDVITSSLEGAKAAVIKLLSALDASSISTVVADIRLLTIMASLLPACGHVLMAGSDFLDTLADAYETHRREDIRSSLVASVYVGLTSLLKGPKPNLSLLLDQLFGLKASAGVGTPKAKNQPTLLSDVICSSDLLARLERYLAAQPQTRGQELIASLRSYQTESRSFHHRYQKPKKHTEKGKGRASDLLPSTGEIHIHKMSLITQVQDLFPDLGSGYIVRLLDFYGDNPETVVAHLLDESIPAELQTLDKTEQLPTFTHSTPQQQHHDHHNNPMPPRATPPPTRKNIFDNDIDLAELARSNQPTNLRFGRANPSLTADSLLSDRSNHAANKAAIISALAAFDSDDDERDDTYDVADVGGTVDATATITETETDTDTHPHPQPKPDDLDLTLLHAYKSTPTLFSRDPTTRRSQPRAALKRETGMTDEAIEGWAIMLARDPKRLAKLEGKLALSAGGSAGAGAGRAQQPELPSTSYRKPRAVVDGGGSGSDTDTPQGRQSGSGSYHPREGGDSGRGRGRGRGGGGAGGGAGGRGRGGRRGGGGDQNPAASRQKKEENKASRANNNRRQQRARKVARAGGMVG